MRHIFFTLALCALLTSSGLRKDDGNLTYYLPLDKSMTGAKFDTVVMSVAEEEGCDNLDIKVYMSLYPWDKGGRILKI